MAQDIDTGMDKADLRRALVAAGTDGANCAFGDGKGGYALLRLDRHKAQTALAKSLKDDFHIAKVYPGLALLDENDSKRVLFRVEKSVPGMAKKLAKTLKLANFKKVVIESADGSPPEVGDDDEDAAPAAAPVQADAAPAPEAETQAADGPDGAAAPATGAPEPSATAAAAPAAEAAPAAPSPEAAPAFAKTREASVKVSTAWIKMANNVHSEFDKLQTAFLAAFQGNDVAPQLESAFKARVDKIRQFDRELAAKLVAVSKAKDAEEQARLVADARQALQNYQKFIDGDTTLRELDDNPFVPNLGIGRP